LSYLYLKHPTDEPSDSHREANRLPNVIWSWAGSVVLGVFEQKNKHKCLQTPILKLQLVLCYFGISQSWTTTHQFDGSHVDIKI
jgi:hypothetical protein